MMQKWPTYTPALASLVLVLQVCDSMPDGIVCPHPVCILLGMEPRVLSCMVAKQSTK